MNAAAPSYHNPAVVAHTPGSSGPASAAVAESAAFLNFLHSLLLPEDPPVPMTASPTQIADALIKSMMGTPLSPGTSPDTKSGANAGGGKKLAGSISLNRSSGNAGGGTIPEIPVLPANLPGAPGLMAAGDATTAANAGQANPAQPNQATATDTAASSLATGASPASADSSGGAQASGSPASSLASQTATAFAARLTPKADSPDAGSSPAGSPLPVPSKRASNPELTSKLAQADASSPDPRGNSGSGDNFLSHMMAAVPALGAAGGAGPAAAPAIAGPQSLAAPSLSEPIAPPGTAHVREFTVRIAAPDAPPVDVQVNQRQGQVYVAVRTADLGLQTSLRQDLPQLVNSLDRAGFRTETFIPHASGDLAVGSAAETSLGNSAQDSSHDSPQDSSRQHGAFGRDPSHSSGQQNQQQQQQQQRQREQMQHRWLDQMED